VCVSYVCVNVCACVCVNVCVCFQIDAFAEEFIGLEGIEAVVRVIRVSEGNTEAYALKALGVALTYVIHTHVHTHTLTHTQTSHLGT